MKTNVKPIISEKQFQSWVRKAALTNGFLCYHTWNSFRSDPGFPDTVLVHPRRRRLIFAELKSEKGQLTEKQKDWIAALNAARCNGVEQHSYWEVYTWRPSDMDTIWSLLSK